MRIFQSLLDKLRDRRERRAMRVVEKWANAPVEIDRSEASRKRFYATGMKRCIRCATETVPGRSTDNVRVDGDAYGEVLFLCPRCDWATAFLFDEQGDCFFFETQRWPRRPD